MKGKDKKKGKTELIKMENFLKNENSLKVDDKIEKNTKTFDKIMFLYTVAGKEVVSKLEIIQQEFKLFYDYDVIDSIKTRIKSVDSIINKMKTKDLELTYQDMIENINDIAGVRVICPLKKDVFSIINLIRQMPNIRVIKEKDYITKPKKSGYSSYHLIVEVPVNVLHKIIYVKVEIQIRTMAMDFCSSLEHKINYKYEKDIPKGIKKELRDCAKLTQKLDKRMSNLGKNLIEDEKQIVNEITAEYSTVYTGLMLSEHASL